MEATRREAVLIAVRQLKAKGVTAIKVELEANMQRDSYEHDEDYCLNWLLNSIAERTDTARGQNDIESEDEEASVYNPFPWMKFARFYNDGSVDSELTFTITLDDEANVFYLPHITEVFRDLGNETGGHFDVSGAGMHTALLFSSDASYPHSEDDNSADYNSHRLDETMLRNYKRSVTQLLPALYLLATSNEESRALHYRIPRVSVDWNSDYEHWGHETKYSAITYRDGAIEYRIFDTCYDHPETTLDNIVVIANTMKYMSKTYKSPGIDKKMRQLRFGCSGRKVERFYASQHHLEALNTGLTKIKPSYYSVRDVKRQRKFARTLSTVRKLRDEQHKSALIEFQEYDERFKWQMEYRELMIKGDAMQNVVDRLSTDELRDLNHTELNAQITPQIEESMNYWQRQRQSAGEYIANRMENFDQTNRGEYTLTFNQ